MVRDLAPGFYKVQVDAVGRAPVKLDRVAIRAGDTTNLEVILFPGQHESDAFTFLLDKNTDPERFRMHVTAMLNSVDSESKGELIRGLVEDTEELPVLRQVLEELIKKR